MLSAEHELVVNTVSDHLNRRKTESISNDVDWNTMLRVICEQQLGGIISYQIKDQVPDEKISTYLNAHFSRCIFSSVIRNNLLKEIHDEFAKNKIAYLIFKGTEIAGLYPEPLLRTMGDSDILVHLKDKERAHKALLNLGFENKSRGSDEWIYIKKVAGNGQLVFELHSHLQYQDITSLQSHEVFFNQVWDNAEISDGTEYHLNWTYHLIFLILHLRKHFMKFGVGIRQFVDVAVVINKPIIDKRLFQEKIQELELFDFTRCIFSFIYRWFGIKTDLIPLLPIEDEFFIESTSKILGGGVFGFSDKKHSEDYRILQIKDNKNSNVNAKNKALVCLGILFPSYDDMCNSPHYQGIIGKPYLLPFFWIYRWFSAMKRKTFSGCVRSATIPLRVSQDRINERMTYLTNWGIN